MAERVNGCADVRTESGEAAVWRAGAPVKDVSCEHAGAGVSGSQSAGGLRGGYGATAPGGEEQALANAHGRRRRRWHQAGGAMLLAAALCLLAGSAQRSLLGHGVALDEGPEDEPDLIDAEAEPHRNPYCSVFADPADCEPRDNVRRHQRLYRPFLFSSSRFFFSRQCVFSHFSPSFRASPPRTVFQHVFSSAFYFGPSGHRPRMVTVC